MASKTMIPESVVIKKSKGATQFYDRNGNIASLPNKSVKVFSDLGDDGLEQAWAHPQAGADDAPAAEPEGAESGVGPNGEGVAGEPDAFLEALDGEPTGGEGSTADMESATSSESSEEPAATAPAKSKSRGSGKAKVKTMATAKAKVAAAPKKAAVAKVAPKKAGKVTVVAKTQTKAAGNGALIRTVKGRPHDISGYTKVKNASGHVSYDNGDDIAEKLRGMSLEAVYQHAAKGLKEDLKALQKKYAHLNPGMQRMSLGNRLRKLARAKAEKAAA